MKVEKRVFKSVIPVFFTIFQLNVLLSSLLHIYYIWFTSAATEASNVQCDFDMLFTPLLHRCLVPRTRVLYQFQIERFSSHVFHPGMRFSKYQFWFYFIQSGGRFQLHSIS